MYKHSTRLKNHVMCSPDVEADDRGGSPWVGELIDGEFELFIPGGVEVALLDLRLCGLDAVNLNAHVRV